MRADDGPMTRTCLTHLECSDCGRPYDAGIPQTLCALCHRPLVARYQMEFARAALKPQSLSARVSSLWRYRELLPAARDPVTLGEGWTPLVQAPRLGERLGLNHLFIKDESLNPTGSFKARGMAVAVTMARERGAFHLSVPTAGNAGLALAAYAAAAGLRAHIFCPADTPRAFVQAPRLLGAVVELVPGVITDCGRVAVERAAAHGWFDLSTLKEPYRLEGKKTLGFELWEQLGGRLPDAIVYPTGGGTGLLGMWKAFDELEALGWIGPRRPRMICVQAADCAPVVRAFHENASEATPWAQPATVASGLRVPAAVGDRMILQALRASGGTAVAVPDEEMIEGARLMGADGVLAAPEGGATVAAARRLLAARRLDPDETVVLFNTGTALSYLEALRIL